MTISTSQAAAMLQVTPKRILQLIRDGKLVAWKGKRSESKFDKRYTWKITFESVQTYAIERERWAVKLAAWRRSWAIAQANKRRRKGEARRLADEIEANNRAVFERTGWTPPRAR